eukprot:COSAG02_NODE_5570_length_4223_cov_2.546314_2_plen_77_part_00
MMELVLHDLSELRAAWVDAAARRGVVTRMYVNLSFDIATKPIGCSPAHPNRSFCMDRYRSYLFLQSKDYRGWIRDD